MPQPSEQQFNTAMQRVISAAPEGLSEADFNALVDAELSQPVASHEPASAKDYSQFGPMQLLMRDEVEGGSLSLKELAEQGPMVGGLIGGLLGNVPGAAVGGAGGTLVRDLARANRGDPNTPTSGLEAAGNVGLNAAGQAGMQKGGNLVAKGLQRTGRWLMKGGIPKNIKDDFGGNAVAQKALDTFAVPGSEAGARRISGLSKIANQSRDTAALGVPVMPRSAVLEKLRPLHAEATAAKEPELAADVLAYMRESARNIGPQGLTGAEQLARKGVKQRLGKAAITAANPRTAAMAPQLANAERGAITSHLRETPAMGKALDDSQSMMGLDRWMQGAKENSVIAQGRQSALASLLSPTGLAVSGHGVNQAGKAISPEMLRALALMAQLQDQE